MNKQAEQAADRKAQREALRRENGAFHRANKWGNVKHLGMALHAASVRIARSK